MKEKSQKKNSPKIIGILFAAIVLILVFLALLKGCSTKQYTVKFDSNGGNVVENIKVKENKKVKRPKDPIKEGYVFDGWYYKDKLFKFNTKITKNITLKAHWKESLISLNMTNLNMVVGKDGKLELSKIPDGLKLEDLVWTTSDEKIVTVDQNGHLKALKSGEVTITVKTKDGKYSANCKVTVTEKEIEIESISINGSSQVTVGNSIKLTVSFKPSNATSQELKWESSNSKIATVDENGNVRGLKEGTVTITVTTKNGKTTTKKITVKASTTQNKSTNNKKTGSNGSSGSNTTKPTEIVPNGVSISGSKEVYIGSTIQLIATVTPTNATNKNVTWSINNGTGSATIDQSGRVTGIKAGTVIIKVTTSNGKTSTYQVTVKEREANYVLILKEIKNELSTIQYEGVITKNGSIINDNEYYTVLYNGVERHFKGSNKYITSINKNILTATIYLANGESAQMKVQYE